MVAMCMLLVALSSSTGRAATVVASADPLRLDVPGAPSAFYFTPASKAPKPIIMYLHGRGGNPMEDCRKWGKVARAFGWVVCPSGPGDSGDGGRTWLNGVAQAQQVIASTTQALRAKYKNKVLRQGHILIGFSEGAFIAMQVGLKEQATWSRWLVLAASDQYWGPDVSTALARENRKVKRVYLLTGENDGVAANTVRVGEVLMQNKVPVKVKLVPGLGHEVPHDRMVAMYRKPLAWLAGAK